MTVELAWTIEGPAGAPVLVLLNSLGANTSMWDPEVGALAEQFRVARIDHRGHGQSSPSPAGAPSSMADLGAETVAAINAIRAAAQVERVHLAGLSLGGMVAMWIAAHRPELVARLALLCTSAHLSPAQGWLDRAHTVRTEGLAAIAGPVTARWITAALAERDPALAAGLQQMLTSNDPESYAQCCEAISGMDQRPDLVRIATPTLIIAGADDVAIPAAHSEVLAAAMAPSTLQILRPAAHLATLEAAGSITQLLLSHFRGGGTLARGFVTRRAVLGDEHVDRATATTTEFTAPFQEFITRYAWGDIWSRPELSRRDRSLVTITALVTLGAEHELAMHVAGAVRNGLTEAEISEIILHTALYAGLPRANRALAIAQETLDH
jgi:3-oxoadipate enol-lactonase / 4-carboxymuconolactone decarboxylase